MKMMNKDHWKLLFALACLAAAQTALAQPRENLLAFVPSFVPQGDPSIQLNRIFDAAGNRIYWPLPWPQNNPIEPSPARAAPPLVPRAYRRTFNILMARRGEIDRYDALILQNAVKYRLNPKLLKAIMAAESEFNAMARSPAGALGLMQVMPATAEWMGVPRRQLFNPEANIRAGASYLAHLFKVLYRRYGLKGLYSHAPEWVIRRAIAAYNAGTRFLSPRPLFRETRHYVAKVLLYHMSEVAALRQHRTLQLSRP